MKLPFPEKKTDDQEGGESEAVKEKPAVIQEKATTAEGVRDKVRSRTHETWLTDKIEILKKAKDKISSATNHEEIDRLREETKMGMYRRYDRTEEGSRLCDEYERLCEECEGLLNDKVEEIYGVRIYGNPSVTQSALSWFEKYNREVMDGAGHAIGRKGADNYYKIYVGNRGYRCGHTVTISFKNGEKIVFDDPKKKNKIFDALLAQAENISVDFQINYKDKKDS